MSKKIDYSEGRRGSEYLTIRPGDQEVTMLVVDSAIEPSKYTDVGGQPRQDVVLIVDVDGEARKWRLNAGGNRALDAAGVEVGDLIRVARREDAVEDGRTLSQWGIEVLGEGGA